MYDNIGEKIKSLAKASFIVVSITEVITGIALMIAEDYLILLGLLIMIVGPIVTWLSSWLLYGFGQLIENSDIIAAEYNRKNEKHEKAVIKNNQRKQAQRQKEVKESIINPEVDEDVFIDITCPNCKAELSYPKGQLQCEDGVTCPMCDAHITV